MEMEVCVAVPPYFTNGQVKWLEQVFTEFRLGLHAMQFINQPLASLTCFAEEGEVGMCPGEFLTVCHMEEEITVRRIAS
jgi:hypothetical protein